MGILNPTKTRLSPHFLLSDMMGNDSVYSQGLRNVFNKGPGQDVRLANARALCENALEPILAMVGSFSISYGFISPELSGHIVKYQDPRLPSHHRFDLGAAVDICPHAWVQSIAPGVINTDSPIEFALTHLHELPLSRLITYSESPYICVAVSADEVRNGSPRRAWYENRFEGRKGAKPKYLKYPTASARTRALDNICKCGLEHDWVGKGFPSYHGGGRRQLHHRRVSQYTVMSDWLYDEDWVTEGVKNVPSFLDPDVMDAFELAGQAYDKLLDATGLPRFSIVSGYTSPKSKNWIEGHDWRGDLIEFELVPPAYTTPGDVILSLLFGKWPKDILLDKFEDRLIVKVKR
jgi:hypothetical protein